MADIAASEVTIGGFAVPFAGTGAASFAIKFTRGISASRFEFPIDPLMVEGLKNGIVDATGTVSGAMPARPEIVIKTADPGGTRQEKVTIEGWYFLGVSRASGGWYKGTVADPRHGLAFQKLTGAYNIRGYNGGYKHGTLNGLNPWTVGEFLIDAFSRIGQVVTLSDKIPADLIDAYLPDNLANFESGMLFGAAPGEWLPTVLESIRCDLTIDTAGGFHIVERSDESALSSIIGADNVINNPAVAGIGEREPIGPHDIHWQKPSIIRVLFRRLAERRMQIRGNGLTQTEGREPQLENVAIPYTYDANGVPEIATAAFAPIEEVVYTALGLFGGNANGADRWLRERILRPSMINLQGLDVVDVRQKSAAQSILRQAFRRWWRIKGVADSDSEANKRVYSKLGDMKFGRITEDGSAEAPAVFGTWVERRKYGVLEANAKHVLEQEFTANHRYPSPAPFDVEWLDSKQGVIQLKPSSESVHFEDAYIGLLKHQATFETPENLAKGLPIRFSNYGEFNEQEKADIYFVAEIIQDYKDLTRVQGDSGATAYALTRNLPNGEPFAIEYRVDDLTANYQARDDEAWPGDLLNATALAARADQIRDRVAQQFNDAPRSGVANFGGVGIFRWIKKPEGAILEMEVRIGDAKAFGITSTMTVLPEARKKVPPLDRSKRQAEALPDTVRVRRI